jgi:hypothetical protein
VDVVPCATCGDIGESVSVDLQAGEALPSAAANLQTITEGIRRPQISVRRCPTCGAWFRYEHDYESGAFGDGWERAFLNRIGPERVIAVLMDSPPSRLVTDTLAALGVTDAEAALTKKLVADLENPQKSYEAARLLVDVYLDSANTTEIVRLLRHPSVPVRKNVLYLLQCQRSALVFRAAAAASDPDPDRRIAAEKAVVHRRDDATERAIIECLDAAEPEVRSSAAWALAVLAGKGTDLSPCISRLATLIVEDSNTDVRNTAARTLIAAANTGVDCSPVFSILERLATSDTIRNRIRDGAPSLAFLAPTRAPVAPPAVVVRAPRPPPPPASELLSADEVNRLWANAIPIDAAYLPEELLARAIAESRVKRAVCSSSMGTAETFWSAAEPTEEPADVRPDGVVLPPGQTAITTPYEEWADDRNSYRVLWEPFYDQQGTALSKCLTPSQRDAILRDCGAILVRLEEQWAQGAKRTARESLLRLLRDVGPVEPTRLQSVLAEHKNTSVRHLVRGIRARWITFDVEAAMLAIISSAVRFDYDNTLRRARLEFLRCAADALR